MYSLQIRFTLENIIPPCAAVCQDPLPVPAEASGLNLTGFIPVAKPDKVLDPFAYLTKYAFFHEDDRFVFRCKDPDHGVYGGPHADHRSFKCTKNGVYDTPSKDDDPPREWPQCKDQRNSKRV